MFASNMKVLTLNTNCTSPTVEGGGGTQTIDKVFNNIGNGGSEGGRVGSGSSGLNHKLNKREQKHNSKTKFIHGNSNKMQQLAAGQMQSQKYHQKNNNNCGKLKSQHFNNTNNSNSTSSMNRKKYYQQQQHHQLNQQQQQNQHQHQKQYQQQQYLTVMQQTINPSQTTITITNNNSSSVKRQNYCNIDILAYQHKQNSINNNTNNANSVLNHNTNLIDTCTCGLHTNNCDKLSLSSRSPGSSSSAAVEGDCHRQNQQSHNTCCNTNFKSSLISNSKSSPLNATQANNSIPSTSTTCWSKLPQQLQSGNCLNFKSSNTAEATAAVSKCESNQNFSRTISSSSLSTTSSSTSSGGNSTNTASYSVPKKKSFWKNSNTGTGGASTVLGGGNSSLSSATSSGSTIQSPKLSKEKEYHVLNKNVDTNATKNLCKNYNNAKEQKCSSALAASGNSSQKSQISKNPSPIAEKRIMSNSLAETSGTTLIKTSAAANNNSNTPSLYSSKHSTISSKQQQDTLEKVNDCKQILKSPSNKSNNKSDSIKTTTTTSSSTTTSPQNAYSLDFLHSVGVKMTGVAVRSPEKQASTNTYGNQCQTNSPAQSNYSYTGITTYQRQPRYMYGGSNSNNGNSGNQQQQHYHHHQPSQLTIASFLHKDLLAADNAPSNESSTAGSGGTSSSSNSRNTNNCNDQRQQRHYTHQQQQQQPHTHTRYHHNYYGPPYHQQSGVIHNTNNGGAGGYGTELGRLVSKGSTGVQRNSSYGGYTNYHNTEVEGGGMSKDNTPVQQQHPRQLKNNIGYNRNSVNNSQANKKPSSYASSITSNSSSSSSKSISSNSSKISSRQLQTVPTQAPNNNTSKLNLAIETLPSKNVGGANQRSNQRGGQHSHYNNHHNHHQHIMMNSPNVMQHQNYYNLTYVATDGSAGGTGHRGCSPAPQSLPPTPSPKSLENSPGHVSMLMNFNGNHLQYSHYPHAQQLAVQQQHNLHQQFQARQQQQQTLLNKKIFLPLSLNLPSPSPSSTPLPNTAGLSINPHHTSMQNNNIIACSQLDESTTAASAVGVISCSSSASSGIIAGNDCDSDASNHSSTQTMYHSLKSLKSSSVSSTSSSSPSAASTSAEQAQQQSCSQPAIAANCGPTPPLHSSLDYNYSTAATQTFNNLQMPQHAQLPQLYGNNGGAVISVHNLPPNTQNIYTDEDYQQHLQHHHQLYLSTTSNHKSADNSNVASTLTAVTNCSNNSGGYWSPSYPNQFLYHQTSSPQVALMPATNSSSSSCGSSSASISPCLPNEEMQQQTQQRLHSNCSISGAIMSPSPCASLNEQFSNIIVSKISNSDSGMSLVGSSSCSSNSSSVSGCSNNGSGLSTDSTNGGQTYKMGSSQLFVNQQRLVAQQTYQSSSSSTSSFSNSSASTLTSAVRENGLNTNNGRNSQLQQLPQTSINSSMVSSGSGAQQLSPTTTQHIYSHHYHHHHHHHHHHQHQEQHQSLPAPLPPHNLLYNSPQIHHMRALSSSAVHDFFTHTPPDRFLARAHLIEAKEAPPTLLNNSKWDQLSQDIWKKFINSQQTEETFKQKMHLWRYLYLFIKNAYPRYGLYLVGSTISGFGSDSSDVDMCLVSRSASSIDPRMEALFNLTVLRDCLSKSGEFENFNLIEAKVPILRFCDRMHQLEVDLNFNNCVGIKNTHLLYCYSQLDWRLRPLVLVTKLWAQYHNINNAKNMTISSYSLVLMVIHFLQSGVDPPVLPCLHAMFPDKFPLLRSNDFGYVDMGETILPYDSKNTQSIGELFVRFLEYYTFFDYTQFAISVRTGGLLPVNLCRVAKSLKNDIHQWKELCIEEPFDLTNTARSVYDYETFERVKTVFLNSWRLLQETLNLNSVFSMMVMPSSSSCSIRALNLPPNIIPTASSTTALGEIQSNFNVTDSNTNDYGVLITAGESYEENSKSSIEHDNEESILDVDDDNSDDGDNNVTATNSSFMANNWNFSKCKDLNRTLTPGKNQIFGENEFPFPPPSPSALNCRKAGTKNVNRNNNNNSNNKTTTPLIS